MQIGEETLTDINILELTSKHPLELYTNLVTKHAEGKTGADWEWWFRGKTDQWLGFKVQAKILNLSSNTFPHLHYKQHKSGSFQSNLLIKSALNSEPRMIPLYCLYLNIPQEFEIEDPLTGYQFPISEIYGCSVISAFLVAHLRNELKSNSLKDLIPYLSPWHSLICKSGLSHCPDDLAERVLYLWKNRFMEYESEWFSPPKPQKSPLHYSIRKLFNNSYKTICTIAKPPNYVKNILSRDNKELTSHDLPVNVSRVVIISQSD